MILSPSLFLHSLSHASSPLRSRAACWSSCAAYSSRGWRATIKGHARLHTWQGYCTSHCVRVWWGDRGGKPAQWGAHVVNILRIVELMKRIPAPSGRLELESYIFWSDGNRGSRHGAWTLLLATVGRWSRRGEWIDEAKEENLKEADGKEKRLLLQSERGEFKGSWREEEAIAIAICSGEWAPQMLHSVGVSMWDVMMDGSFSNY
jgi:hypothetical protein